MNSFKTVYRTIIENIHLFATLDEVRAFALQQLIKRNILGVSDMDNSWDTDDWVNSKEFILWLLIDKENIPDWFHKQCVFELLKYKI